MLDVRVLIGEGLSRWRSPVAALLSIALAIVFRKKRGAIDDISGAGPGRPDRS